MIHERETISVETNKPEEIIDITPELTNLLNQTTINEGFMNVFPQHTSSAVFINDSDPSLLEDIRDVLGELVPEDNNYRHNSSDPKQNATAHIKSILTGHHVTIPITNGKFDFGTYHTVYYAEFDGQRPKKISVKLLGES
ncbi:MAG: secondary thiamine-phosphate synthase enzyme YjbQ [bacterium]